MLHPGSLLHSRQELKTIFEKTACDVLQYGIRRNCFYIAAPPLRIFISMIKNKGRVEGNVFLRPDGSEVNDPAIFEIGL